MAQPITSSLVDERGKPSYPQTKRRRTVMRSRAHASRTRSRAIAALLCLVVSLLGRAARAAPSVTVVLDYDAPPECPDRAWVLARVEGRVRHAPSSPLRASVSIRHVWGRERGHPQQRYESLLVLEGGRRVLVSNSCDSLVETVSLVLALALEPKPSEPKLTEEAPPPAGSAPSSSDPATSGSSGTAPGDAARAAPPVPTPGPVETQPTASTDVSSAATDSRGSKSRRETPSQALPRRPMPVTMRPHGSPKEVTATSQPPIPEGDSSTAPPDVERPAWSVHPEVSLLIEYGMLPSVAAGPAVGVWFDRKRLSFGTTALWLVPRWAQLAGTDQPIGGYISFLGGQANACLTPFTSINLRTCAGVEAGDLMGKGSGLTEPQLGHGIWLSGLLESTLRLRISKALAAEFRVGLALPVKRPVFGLDGYDWRFEPRPWSVRLMTGFLWF